jgi:hypothetical protein
MLYRLERILREQLQEIDLNPSTYTTQDRDNVYRAASECWWEIEALEAEDWWFWQQILNTTE